MRYLDLTLENPAENLALDEALLLQAEAGDSGEVLRIWECSSPALVLGSNGRIADDVNEAACQSDGVPIFRRSSGGGTVLLGPGCLCFTLVLRYERSPSLCEVRASNAYILDRIRDGLNNLQPNIERAGLCDLAIAGRKFSGNAQHRKRHSLLHHGTLIYNIDLCSIACYLRVPARQPGYREGRSHVDFLMNFPASFEQLTLALRASWSAFRVEEGWPKDLVRRLTEEKYHRRIWTRRR